MFCLVTDLTDIEEHPAPQLAAVRRTLSRAVGRSGDRTAGR